MKSDIVIPDVDTAYFLTPRARALVRSSESLSDPILRSSISASVSCEVSMDPLITLHSINYHTAPEGPILLNKVSY